MSTFAELLVNSRGRMPGDVQAEAAREFCCRVRKSRLYLRRPDEPLASGTVVVLGVASYSPEELTLLDDIDARYDHRPPDITRVDVFNVLDCHSQQDFQKFLPGSQSDVHQTPVLGIWIDQQLQSIVTGLAAVRKTLASLGML